MWNTYTYLLFYSGGESVRNPTAGLVWQCWAGNWWKMEGEIDMNRCLICFCHHLSAMHLLKTLRVSIKMNSPATMSQLFLMQKGAVLLLSKFSSDDKLVYWRANKRNFQFQTEPNMKECTQKSTCLFMMPLLITCSREY